MDDVSKKLLQLLERDASTTVEQLATMLGAPADEITRRISELESSRVLVRRKAVVNWERAGEEWGSTFTFSQTGCWQLHAERGADAGDVWLLVRS